MLGCSVVIPTYNRNQLLRDTIVSLLECIDYTKSKKPDFLFEILIVDQSMSHDDLTKSFLDELVAAEKVKIIYCEYANLPNARNIGVNNSKYEIIIFIDDDVLVDKEFLISHMACYEDNSISGATGKIDLVADNRDNILLNANSFVKHIVKKWLLKVFCKKKAGVIFSCGFMIFDFNKSFRCLTDGVRGCNMSFRKSAVINNGYFDVNYIYSAIREETDLCCRMKSKGCKLIYNPEAALIHRMDGSGGTRTLKGDIYWKNYFDNQIYFYIKNFSLNLFMIYIFLIFDLIACKKEGLDTNRIIKESYSRALNILKGES